MFTQTFVSNVCMHGYNKEGIKVILYISTRNTYFKLARNNNTIKNSITINSQYKNITCSLTRLP